MIKYLDLLLDLLNVEQREQYLLVGEKIISTNKKKALDIHHKLRFVFEGFSQLLNEELPLEDFLMLGDITSQKKLYPRDSEDSFSFLHSLLDEKYTPKDTLLIVDQLSLNLLSSSQQEKILTSLAGEGSEIIAC